LSLSVLNKKLFVRIGALNKQMRELIKLL